MFRLSVFLPRVWRMYVGERGLKNTSYQALNLAHQIRLLGDALIPREKNNVRVCRYAISGKAVTERNPRMSEFLSFAIGTTLGGMVGVACMCLLQINRLSEGKEGFDAEKECADTVPTDRGRS